MKTRRNAGGYTLPELIAVIAILLVLMSLGAARIISYQRTVTQAEFDGIAREIFVAAQNHLTMAESQGFMGISEDENEPNIFGIPYQTPDKKLYYYVVNDELREELRALGKLTMLDLMLPAASVDGTVRLGGSYVILYQLEPALALDVFYAPESGKFQHMFDPAEVNAKPDAASDIDWITYYRGDAETQRQKRGHYGADNAIIGWYGSAGAELPLQPGEPLNPPTITVVNAERLYVDVLNPNTSEDLTASVNKSGLRLVVVGEQSGNSAFVSLWESVRTPAEPIPGSFHFILDDVTSAGKHFHDICGNLYPGENIAIYAEAYNNQELTNIADSASVTTNSLFASLKEAPDVTIPGAYDTFAAGIANFRHLENLGKEISDIRAEKLLFVDGKETACYFLDENKRKIITRAEQSRDMDWLGFMAAITEKEIGEPGSASVSVYEANGAHSASGCYLPITNGGMIAYDGANHAISNVEINVSGDAGLFAALGNKSTVSDLELWNFSVQSSGGSAGALAGVLREDSAISGALAAHEETKTSKIEGKACVGGLVGEIKGAAVNPDDPNSAISVADSAAAVYVHSTSGDAGGLIGGIAHDNKVTVAVSNSYAGGHTKDGSYEKDYAAKGYYNITGAANAGGLIGSVTGAGSLSIECCYSTASVKGATAGGFVGSASHGQIQKCYATGYVTGSANGNAGAFAGAAAALFSEDGYFSAIAGELSAVGDREGAITGLTELDDSLDAYGAGAAKPYDAFLKSDYKSLYAFRTVKELSGRSTPEWMRVHYGDWPLLDALTLVINERN